MGPQKALETIGANLQKQYENWQPRVSLLHLPFLSQSWVLWFEPEKTLASSQIIQYVPAPGGPPSVTRHHQPFQQSVELECCIQCSVYLVQLSLANL